MVEGLRLINSSLVLFLFFLLLLNNFSLSPFEALFGVGDVGVKDFWLIFYLLNG